MYLSRPLTGISVLLLTAGLFTSPATAAPSDPAAPPASTREFGNGPERNELAATAPEASASSLSAAPDIRWVPKRQGYPRQTTLRVYPENPADRSIKLGLIPYHGIAPRLNALQAASDRVSAEVVGQSALGRDAPGRTAPASTSTAITRPVRSRNRGRSVTW